MQSSLALVAVLALVGFASASKFGVDISGPTTTKAIQCIGGQTAKNEDNLWLNLMVRLGHYSTGYDGNATDTLNSAGAAQLSLVDGYIVLCPKKQIGTNTTDYVGDILGQMQKLDVFDFVQSIYLTVVDTDGDGSCWNSDSQKNVDDISDAIAVINRFIRKFGIYTNAEQWQKITNNSTDLPNNSQLWWASPGAPTFSDFVPFGVWTDADLRQYEVSTADKPITRCGLTVNKNFGQDKYTCQQGGKLCDDNNPCCPGPQGCKVGFLDLLPNPPRRCYPCYWFWPC